MKQNVKHAREYIQELAASGRYSFTSKEARAELGVSAAAAKLALRRRAVAGDIASPARGFYIIVPPEYRALGSLPADQLVPALMQKIGLPYYAGLLTAAQYHGAAHHRPQEFQVMLPRPRRRIECGQVRVAFFVRKHLRDVPAQSLNTPRGTIQVSSPEATALDLIGYEHKIGGLDLVATVISELAERIDNQKLAFAAQIAPVPWAQRLGYLLELVGAADKAVALKSFVESAARQVVRLVPGIGEADATRDPHWKLIVNAKVEPET